MLESETPADKILRSAITALYLQNDALLHVLDDFPAPIYLTDPEGYVTYSNASCAHFAGRTPVLGQDRWCVTWKLYTDAGDFLPHDQCPMAQAIRSRQPVRGATAVAERPDGTRVHFMPFPTPLFSPAGELLGAVNLLIDMTEIGQADVLRAQAVRYRRLGSAAADPLSYKALNRMATEYEVKAGALDLLRPH
jgi:PAS domain-containing protein